MLSNGLKKQGKKRIEHYKSYMYLIDTDIIIWVLRGNRIYGEILQKLKDKASLSLSSITIAEIYKNVFPSEMVKTEEILQEFLVWQLSASIAKQGGLYWQQFSPKYKKLHLLDCLIAATAREHHLTLLTLNTRHFPMKDIYAADPLGKRFIL